MNIANVIPKSIIQYWADEELSDGLKVLSNSWSDIYPDYSYKLYNRDSAIVFLNNHYDEDIVKVFKSLKLKAMQSDLFRIAYILKKGGIYIDMSQKAYRKMDEIINFDNEALYICERKGAKYWNGLIIASPGHQTLNRIFHKVLDNISKKNSVSAWEVTGPKSFNEIVDEKNSILLNKEDLNGYFRGDKLYVRNNNHWSNIISFDEVYDV
tara:strand:+ start:307 stop:936 length:630 start_codon:yes stop_codon:yes gene_type:complete